MMPELRYILVRLNYQWKQRYNYVLLLFVIAMYFLLLYSFLIHLFDVVTFFDEVRITLYFGNFDILREITL